MSTTTTTTVPVQLYVLDQAFINRAIPAPPLFSSTGGIAQLSARALSYFKTPYELIDPRPSSSRNVTWASQTSASILVDNAIYSSFVTALTSAVEADNAALFAIIDILAFNYNAATSIANLDSLLTSTEAIAPYYQAGSLALGPTNAAGTVYYNNGTQAPITCPTKISFVFNVVNGTHTLSYAITVWIDNATFLASYTNSTIIGVIPPTDYSDLLYLAFQANGATLAADAAQAAFSQPLINQAAQASPPSGYAPYVAKVISGTASLNMTFIIAYIGQLPTFAAMRTAILSAIEASGIGTQPLWQARIPELYVSSRIYLVPIWDQVITNGSGTLYAGIASPNAQMNKAAQVLGSITAAALVPQYGECLTAAYNLLPIVAVPDAASQPVDSLETLYPSYQACATNDPNYLYMSADTQSFAGMLNAALPVAAGVTSNASYPIVTDGTLNYVAFTQGLTEFCIITEAFYDQQLGVAA